MDRWRRLDVVVRDLPLAALLAVASLVPVLQGYGTRLGDLPGRPFDAAALAVIGLECLPLAVRRRWPGVCLALVSLGFAADQLLAYQSVAGTALPIALVSAAAYLERRRLFTVALLTAAYVPLALALDRQRSVETLSGYVTFYLALSLAWGAGAWLRLTRAVEAERRHHLAETTRTAERTRIAGELHDVVTHHVTAMVVQAEAARYLTADPERLDAALTAVGDTGRSAIADLRSLLDLLDPHHGHPHGTRPAAPSAHDLHTLVEQTRRAGQPVELTTTGTPDETADGVTTAVHRVVQEALTNALKHAPGARTVVHVRHGVGEVVVAVGTDRAVSPRVSPGGSGRGLDGLRERIALLGGRLTARPRPGGGFDVQARIPTAGPT